MPMSDVARMAPAAYVPGGAAIIGAMAQGEFMAATSKLSLHGALRFGVRDDLRENALVSVLFCCELPRTTGAFAFVGGAHRAIPSNFFAPAVGQASFPQTLKGRSPSGALS